MLARSSIVSELGFIVSFVWVRAIYRFLKSVCERLVRILSSCKVLPLSYFPEYIGLYQNIYTDWSNWFNIISITLLFSLCKFTCRGIFAKTFYLCMSFSTRYFIHFRTVPLLILVTTTVGGVDKVISKKESIYWSFDYCCRSVFSLWTMKCFLLVYH